MIDIPEKGNPIVDAVVLKEKIKAFLKRVTENLEALNKSKQVPIELSDLISLKELQTIYWGIIFEGENFLWCQLKGGMPYRLSKEQSKLPHTLNLIFEPEDNELCLILETKRKIRGGAKNSNLTPLAGRYKSTKLAWRIDSSMPEKYANSVYYFNDNYEGGKARHEVALSKMLQDSRESVFINVMTEGVVIQKSGERRWVSGDEQMAESYNQKISLYSKWANEGDLQTWLDRNPTLDQREINCITTQLLIAIQHMHHRGWVHQDLKPANILVFSVNENIERVALSDFGSASRYYGGKHIALATYGFESPEISAIHFYGREDRGYRHSYFHQRSQSSHGRGVFKKNWLFYKKQIQFQPKQVVSAHPANDMWALGIILAQLYFRDGVPTSKIIASMPPNLLIEGLLEPNRERRLTATQALSLHYKMMSDNDPFLIQKEFESGSFKGLNLLEYFLIHKEEAFAKALLKQDPSAANHIVSKSGPYQDNTALTFAFTYGCGSELTSKILSASKDAEHYQESLELGQYLCRTNKIKNPEVKSLIFSAVNNKGENKENENNNAMHDLSLGIEELSFDKKGLTYQNEFKF